MADPSQRPARVRHPQEGLYPQIRLFATRYGGMDLRFQLDGQWLDTPAGIAHYLEHKMFDTEDGNAPCRSWPKNGAEPNAFTSNAMTGYYFDSTEHFEENLRILLSFVSIPYFTDESVEKEQGIIAQEIGMIEDNPEWQVYKCPYAGPLPYQPRPGQRGRVRGEHQPHHRPKLFTIATGILYPRQHVPGGRGRSGSGVRVRPGGGGAAP